MSSKDKIYLFTDVFQVLNDAASEVTAERIAFSQDLDTSLELEVLNQALGFEQAS